LVRAGKSCRARKSDCSNAKSKMRKVIVCVTVLTMIEDDVNLRDNRDVFDDKTAQLLTSEEINNFRSGMTSREIISTIVSNNVNFEKKSAFSQEKYLRSKEQRFLRAFTPVQPTVGNVCEFLWSDRRERCMYDPS